MNWENRTLYRGDNLEFMRSMNSGSVHLIATDPPFNKGRDFHAAPESLASGASFSDRWRWDEDVQPDWLDQIQDDWPAAWAVIDSSRATYGDDMAAFLCFMAVQLMAMRRLPPDYSRKFESGRHRLRSIRRLCDDVGCGGNGRPSMGGVRRVGGRVQCREATFGVHECRGRSGRNVFIPDCAEIGTLGTNRFRRDIGAAVEVPAPKGVAARDEAFGDDDCSCRARRNAVSRVWAEIR